MYWSIKMYFPHFYLEFPCWGYSEFSPWKQIPFFLSHMKPFTRCGSICMYAASKKSLNPGVELKEPGTLKYTSQKTWNPKMKVPWYTSPLSKVVSFRFQAFKFRGSRGVSGNDSETPITRWSPLLGAWDYVYNPSFREPDVWTVSSIQLHGSFGSLVFSYIGGIVFYRHISDLSDSHPPAVIPFLTFFFDFTSLEDSAKIV